MSCIAIAKFIRSPLRTDRSQTLALQPLPLRLPKSTYQIFVTHSYRFIQTGIGEWRVSSLRYTYAVELASDDQEVVAFHWEGRQTGAVPFAHMHLGHANAGVSPRIGPKAHIPTGRVAFEDFIYFPIRDLGVAPLQSDWQQILSKERDVFHERKSW